MEKLIYVLWRGDRDLVDVPGHLREVTAPALVEAGARFVEISVVDTTVADGAALRIGSETADKDAVVSFWLEESFDRAECEAIVAAAADTVAGYLVAESRPLRTPPEYLHGHGERTDGFHLVTCIRRRAALTHDEFIDQWQGPFRDTAIAGQNTWDYVRNKIIRPLAAQQTRMFEMVQTFLDLTAVDSHPMSEFVFEVGPN